MMLANHTGIVLGRQLRPMSRDPFTLIFGVLQPIVFLTLNKSNANTVGGGQAVLTGPGFVTKDNAETVAQLAKDGTR